MSKYIPFTKEELWEAHHKDIKEYLESIGETVLKSGTEYMWERHTSLKFRGHVWYQHSTGEKGTIVNLLTTFFDFTFQEAVITLLDGKYSATRNTTAMDIANAPEKRHPKSNIILPQKNENNKRLFAYLCNYRKIDPIVVKYFVNKNLIYEDKNNHNIIYIGKDKKGVIKYAGKKGTLSDINYRGELTGSDKKYCFRHIGTSDTLYVFEAFIDLFSYISLYQLQDNWHIFNYIALGGLNYDILNYFLNSYPHIKKIIICTDNDYNSKDGINHGQVFAKRVKETLSEKYYTDIHIPELKDWNEVLINKRSKNDE